MSWNISGPFGNSPLGASLMILSYGIGGIVSGYLLDRMAPRWIITIGATVAATGLILTGFVQSPWQYYLTYGVLCGLGTSCFGVVACSSSVGKWFIKKEDSDRDGVGRIGAGTRFSPLSGNIVQVKLGQGFFSWGSSFLSEWSAWLRD